mmetsp:Transcript_27658/g.88713  ORF Transcript_27658/g.88713 Transcript_27658/m.88713 type:complete len:209 (+) Transcript_27658:1224-1850(+)
MICESLTVRSSSLEPTLGSAITDGRIGTGGTSSLSTSSASGRPCVADMSRRGKSAGTMARSSALTRSGVRSSCAFGRSSATSEPARTGFSKAPFGWPVACSNEETNVSRSRCARSEFSFGGIFSCTIRAKPTLRTSPFLAPQYGHSRTFLQRSTTRLKAAPIRTESPRVIGWLSARSIFVRSGCGSSTRAQSLQMVCSSATTGLRYPM